MLCRNTVCVRGLGQSQQGSGDCLGCFVQRQVQQCSGEGSGEKTRRRCGRICAKPGQGEFGRRFGYAWCEARSASTRFWRMFWRLWYSQVRFNKICGFLFAETDLRSLQPSTPQHPSERFGRKKHAAFRDTTETNFLLKF